MRLCDGIVREGRRCFDIEATCDGRRVEAWAETKRRTTHASDRRRKIVTAMLASLRRAGSFSARTSADHLHQWSCAFGVTPVAKFFQNVEQAPKDPILGITENFLADTNPKKINLGVVNFSPARLSRGEVRGCPRGRIETMKANQWCSSAFVRRRSALLANITWSEARFAKKVLEVVTGVI